MSWQEIAWDVIDPETPLTSDERATLEHIRLLDLDAARWLDEFVVGARRRYFLTCTYTTHMLLRLKNAQGIRNWWTREWRYGAGRPDNVREVTGMVLRLVEQIVRRYPPGSWPGSERPEITVTVAVGEGKRPLSFAVIDNPIPWDFTRHTHIFTFGWWNEVPLKLRLEGGRFVARNLDDEWISGTAGPRPQP